VESTVNKRPPWRRWLVPALEVIIGLPFILFLYLSGLSGTPVASLPPLYWVCLGIIIIVFSLAFMLPDIQMGLVRMMDDPQVREVVARHTRPGAIRLLILGAVAMIGSTIQAVEYDWNGNSLFIAALGFVIFGAGLRSLLWSVLK
jgi:hypothetical protein